MPGNRPDKIKTFKDFEIWQRGIKLAEEIYAITDQRSAFSDQRSATND